MVIAMDYKKKYKDLLERARKLRDKNCDGCKMCMESLFDELAESEDERIKKEILEFVTIVADSKSNKMEWIAWLEKQGDTNETIDKDEIVQGVLRGAAINLITWIDYNAAEGNMCLSNMECEDIVNALVSGDWNKIYAYMKKKLERQGEKPQGKAALEAIKEEKLNNANYCSDCTNKKGCINCENGELKETEQASKWSEEDEENLKHCCYLNKDEVLSWLQSIKQRMIE